MDLKDFISRNIRSIGGLLFVVILVAVGGWLMFGPEPAAPPTPVTTIGILGAKDYCENKSLHAEYANMNYEINCYGQDLGTSQMLEGFGDPKFTDKVDVIVVSIQNFPDLLKNMYGTALPSSVPGSHTVGNYSTAFTNPLTPIVKAEDAQVLVDAGLASWQGKSLYISSDNLVKMYLAQVDGGTWGSIGVPEKYTKWYNAPVVISSTNPFFSGTGWAMASYVAGCLGTYNAGEKPCSRPLDASMITPQLQEQMYQFIKAYGSQNEDNNVLNYFSQWMNQHTVLMVMGSESFPFLFATKVGDPAVANDAIAVVTDFSVMNSNFFVPLTDAGRKYVEDVLKSDAIAKIVNLELGSRMGYKYKTLDPTLATWIPTTDNVTYIQPSTSDTKSMVLCYVGRKMNVPAVILVTKTFGQKIPEGQTADQVLATICQ